ncbi:MAG TPA: deoxyribonuclease V [Ktedonobacterales bacterium]|jgi:deoxyribonuclease V|nr:deoxyribonuclease V [Ktedonobacterales bacterium]
MHDWDVSVEEAVAIQRRLRALVRVEADVALDQVRIVAGVDASYKDVARAAVVALAFPALEVVETAVAVRAIPFPYVPGLLSFREAPAVLDALAKLRARPDVLIFDGQGLAHPRRLGLASHLGVYLDMPSVGCAKSRLVGRYEEPGPQIGDRAPLVDRGEVVGVALRTKPRTNPLFVSVGHKVDLETAVALVLACLRGYRLPEPTRLADRLAGERALSAE